MTGPQVSLLSGVALNLVIPPGSSIEDLRKIVAVAIGVPAFCLTMIQQSAASGETMEKPDLDDGSIVTVIVDQATFELYEDAKQHHTSFLLARTELDKLRREFRTFSRQLDVHCESDLNEMMAHLDLKLLTESHTLHSERMLVEEITRWHRCLLPKYKQLRGSFHKARSARDDAREQRTTSLLKLLERLVDDDYLKAKGTHRIYHPHSYEPFEEPFEEFDYEIFDYECPMYDPWDAEMWEEECRWNRGEFDDFESLFDYEDAFKARAYASRHHASRVSLAKSQAVSAKGNCPVTHNKDAARRLPRQMRLRGGRRKRGESLLQVDDM